MVKVIVRKQIDSEETLGRFITQQQYSNILIDEDCDMYAEALDGSISEDNIIFKFRKNVFTKEECDAAYQGLRGAAVESQNRGIAAGPRAEKLAKRDWVTDYHHDVLDFLLLPDNALVEDGSIEAIKHRYDNGVKKEDTRGKVWLRNEILKRYDTYDGWFEKWLEEIKPLSKDEKRKEAAHVADNYISDTNYATAVMSGIAGYFDRYPRIPYGRATSYTEKNLEKFALCYPYLRKLSANFKELLPVRYARQRAAADKLDKRFLISDTVFTTLTVNHNWRTACHRDAGDLHEGFSNICGITGPEGKSWRGAEFILPEYRLAINLQPGDMVLVNNHAGIHGNDELIGDDNDRLTIVSYFREKMLELKSWEYEQLRKQYVEERRLNVDHEFHRPLWNGISPGMWDDQEWYDYLKAHNIPTHTQLRKLHHWRISLLDYKIAIPSYKRPETIKKKTLKVLESYNIDPSKITIFVANEDELKDYKKSLQGTPYTNLVVGVPTIGAQRNFIERWYPEGTKLMMFDDDVEEVQKKISEQKLGRIDNLEKEIIIPGFEACKEHGAKTFGIYAAANAYFMKDRVYTKLCYIIASMFGVIVEHKDDLLRVTNHGEDYEYSIRQYIRNGAVVRFDNYTVKSNYYKEDGGLQTIRTKEYVYDSIKKIADMFPDHCSMYIRKSTGNAELRLRDTSNSGGPGSNLESFFG